MPWKKKLDKKTQENVTEQIRGTLKHKNAYKKAKDPSIAQLWIAVANLTQELQATQEKLKKLQPKEKKKATKQNKKELLESLENL